MTGVLALCLTMYFVVLPSRVVDLGDVREHIEVDVLWPRDGVGDKSVAKDKREDLKWALNNPR